jgi:hypothetical protein
VAAQANRPLVGDGGTKGVRIEVVNSRPHERRPGDEAERPRDDAAWKEVLRRALPRDQADTFVAEFEALPPPFSGQRFIDEITAGGDPETVLQRVMMVHNYVRQHGWPANYGIVAASATRKTSTGTSEPGTAKPEPTPPSAEEQEAARIRLRYEKRLSEINQLASAVSPANISRLPQEERMAMKDSVEQIRDWADRLWRVVNRDDS